MTEREKLHEIFSQEGPFKSLVEQSSDGLLVIDSEGIVVFANPAAVVMFSKRFPELCGHCFGVPIVNQSVELILPCPDNVRYVEMRAVELKIANQDVILASLWDITERKLNEEDIRKREALLQKIFDILPVGLWFADNNGTLLRGNPAGIAIWGAEPRVSMDEYGVFKARRWPSMQEIAPDDWALVHAVKEGRTTKDELLEIECFDGVTRLILNSVAPVIDDEGCIEGAVVVNQDVTLKVQAEEALRESEMRFRSLADAGSAIVWTANLEKKCDYFNQPWLDFTGRTFEQEYGFGWTEGVHPDDYERCIEIYVTAFDRREKFSMVYRLRRHDGEYRWIQDDGTPRYNTRGEFIGYIGHCLDITERRQYEIALAKSEEQFRALVEGAPDAIFVCVDEKIAFMNKAAMTLFVASSADELVGSLFLERVHPAFRELSAFRYKKIISEGQPSEVSEKKLLRLDGSEVSVEVSAVPITYLQMPGVLYFVRNIEERMKSQAEKDHLQLQLAQAQKMESVGRLAGGVAHDFNNMLQVIMGEADIALHDMDEQHPFYEVLNTIKDTAARSADLTRQLLTFARRQKFAPKLLDLNDTINGMLKMLRRLIGEDIDLVWKPGFGLWPVKMDPSQLDQLLANLCVNARDAIADVGTITIETRNETIDRDFDPVSLPHTMLAGDYVLLTVSDTGCGMAKETMEQVFEPFFTTKERGKGTGLGLATVYGIVGQSGGEITGYSEPGMGTTFKIYLPREHSEEEVKQSSTNGKKHSPRGKETILMVEDEALILDFASRLMTQLGYTVFAANTPMRALEIAKEYPDKIHLLITDVIMPEMNGRELSRQISALRSDIKSLYMSGYTAGIIAEHGIIAEGVSFLEKPFSAQALAAKVRQILDQT